MFYSIRGRITEISQKFLVIECSGIGYEVLVSNPSSYELDSDVFLYLHHEIKEDDEYLAGFKTAEDKKAFNLLLHVNGIGPKSALLILSKISYDQLLFAISNDDFDFLKSISGISLKTCMQIVFDLKDYIVKCNKENASLYKEVKEILKGLKFKAKEIDSILPGIYIPNVTREELLKEALRRLQNAKNL